MTTVYQTDIPEVPLKARGKVRDIYDLGDQLLIVATDRVSAFDWILPDPIPDKGKVLTQISLFWFDFLSGLAPNHVITGDVDAMPDVLHPYRDVLRGRSMLCRKARPFDAECIVRAYLVGSGWKDYQSTGSVCGVPLPPGLHKGSKFPEPIFTPSTKAEQGLHDENIDETVFRRVVGEDNANRLKEFSLEAFRRCSDYAAEKGIILCDTKLEWGLVGDEIILIDEVFTPDSSRFWKQEDWENTPEGCDPPSFDKQVIRDWLETTDWDKSSPPPKVPDDILELASGRYMEIYERLTGRPLER